MSAVCDEPQLKPQIALYSMQCLCTHRVHGKDVTWIAKLQATSLKKHGVYCLEIEQIFMDLISEVHAKTAK